MSKSFLYPAAKLADELLNKGIETAEHVLSHDEFVINPRPISIPMRGEPFGCGEPYCPICQTNCPPAFTEALKDRPTVFRPSESQFNAPFTVLRTEDTEKRLTEEEEC